MRTWPGALIVGGISLALILAFGPRPAPVPEFVEVHDAQVLHAMLDKYERMARLLSESADEVLAVYAQDVEPIELALLSTGRVRDPMQARLAAWALVRESGPRHLSPVLLARIMRVENPWLKTDTTSSAGAVGWMQAMPFHEREDHPCGTDLTDGDVNVCYGAGLWREYLGQALDVAISKALLRYGGFVRAPGGDRYVARVLEGIN